MLHPATGRAPAEIVFSRKFKTKLPRFSVRLDKSRRKAENTKTKDMQISNVKLNCVFKTRRLCFS